MSDDLSLLVILDTFSDQALVLVTSDLTENEANLMFQEVWLGFWVLFGK